MNPIKQALLIIVQREMEEKMGREKYRASYDPCGNKWESRIPCLPDSPEVVDDYWKNPSEIVEPIANA
jgi:hypothetical protein